MGLEEAMIKFFKEYWAEVLVIGVVGGVLLLCTLPDYTWMNTDSDGIHYVYSAEYLFPSHKTSAPLFLLLGRLFLFIPYGTEAWRIGLMSVIASTGSAIFIYLAIRHHLSGMTAVKMKLYALIGVVIFGGSALVISQSTIVETYALITMFCVGAYYFSLKQRWWLCSIMLGAGLAVHTLALVVAIVILIAKKDFRCFEYAGVMAAFLLFYLYIPITTAINNPPDMWGNTTLKTFAIDNLSTTMMLLGGLSYLDFPKRLLDTIGILGVSLGLSIVPITIMLKKWKSLLFWLFVMPIFFFATNLAMQTYVYLMPSIAFGAILASIGLSRMKVAWVYAVGIVAIGLLIFNANYFDLGRTLDPELSASKFYNEELAKVPDGQILMPQYGWEWASIYPYNHREGRNIIPVSMDTLVSPVYQQQLRERGIKFGDIFEDNILLRQTYIAKTIVEMNENVWTTVTTNPKTYGSEVVLAKDNLQSLVKLPTETIAQWHFKPSNPYDYITGAIEVEEWNFITWSRKNMLVVISLGIYGYGFIWFLLRMRKKRKDNEE